MPVRSTLAMNAFLDLQANLQASEIVTDSKNVVKS